MNVGTTLILAYNNQVIRNYEMKIQNTLEGFLN